MQPSIKQLTEKKLIGQSLNMSIANNKTTELWQQFMPKRNTIKNRASSDFISMQMYDKDYFKAFNPTAGFTKWAAVEVNSFDVVPEGLATITIPDGLYAVFNHKGTDTSIFQYIFGQWIPNSDYVIDNRPHFELLGKKYKNNDPTSEEEIWIPIVKK